jgi:NADPH-dependent 2,4-dienoyl-CoA reductase/sulfur reductase-like enzyme
VVGAGLAGARTVAELRGRGFTGRITVLGAEGLEPYDRPPLSKELLTRTEPAWLRDEVGADVGAADDVRLATPATGLTVGDDGVTVRHAGGELTADAAVIATGAAPRRPAGWGAARMLHTAADAAALRADLVPGARLVVVGAGWIGAEVAGVAAAAGVRVTVLEAAAAPLAVGLGDVGALTVPWYATAGVELRTGVAVRTLTGGPAAPGRGGPVTVVTDDGELTADVVLAAVGVEPASAWLVGGARTVPVAPDGFVVVDAGCLAPGTGGRVAAVGDVARRRSPRHGPVPGGHWDAALRQPELAVASLLGGADPGDPAPYVFSTQLGHELGMYGLPAAGDEVVLRGDPSRAFSAVWFRPGSDEVSAVLAVDRPRDVGAARRLFGPAGPAGPAGRLGLPRLDRDAVAADQPLRRTDVGPRP